MRRAHQGQASTSPEPPSCYHGNVSGGQSDFLTGRSRCDGRWLPGSCCPARPRSSHCHRADTHSPESPLTLFMSVEAPGSDAPCPLGGPRSHSGRVAGCQGDQEALREAPGGAVAGPSADEGASLRHRGWDVPAARPKAGPVLRDAWTLTEATGKPRAQPVPFCPRSALRGVVPGANRNDAILEPLLQV